MLPLRIELAMTFKADFPDVSALHPAGWGGPRGFLSAPEAVSGRNILILGARASFLLVFGAGC
jgi:hypothetical protein